MANKSFTQISVDVELDVKPINWSLCFICQTGGHSKSNPLTQPSRGRGRAKCSAGTNNPTFGFSPETSAYPKTAQLLFQWKELSPGHIENLLRMRLDKFESGD